MIRNSLYRKNNFFGNRMTERVKVVLLIKEPLGEAERRFVFPPHIFIAVCKAFGVLFSLTGFFQPFRHALDDTLTSIYDLSPEP